MAKFLGKFDIATYEQLTGSAAFADRRRLIKNKQRIPFKLRRGKESGNPKKPTFKYVDPPAPDAPVIIKLDENVSYVAIPKLNYQLKVQEEVQNAISGASERRGVEIPATVYNDIRSRISASIVDLPETVLLLVEDTPFTGSYKIQATASTGQVTFAYSGIAYGGFIDRTIHNDSPTATGATWSFANTQSNGPHKTFVNGTTGNELHQSDYTASFIIRTWTSASFTGSHISSAAINSPFHSQSRIDVGKVENYYNSTAKFNRTVLTSRVIGDGNETLFSASFADTASNFYAAPRELLTFPHDTIVASGTFDYGSNFTHLAFKGSSTVFGVNLYWASGSGGHLGLSGSISGGANIASGSHIFLDPALTQPASGGYYSTMNLGTTSSPVGYTIHLAGDGILGVSTAGDLFDNPFLDSYSSGKKVIPAATRWNGQSFTKSS
tara:strand:+ start:2861 stop:4174 length:1314 start_codon:yes stop_codon:yes gene_type:complete